MAERGRGRGGGRGRGRGASTIGIIAQKLNTSIRSLRDIRSTTEPQPLFPPFIIPRPTKLSKEETDMVKYYKNIRNKIIEETPFYIVGKKRPAEDDDDGIVRYRDKYKPLKSHRQNLRGFPTDESFFPDELKVVLQGSGSAAVQRKVKKYNLDDFLEVANEEDVPDQTEDEPKGPARSEIIRNDEDDELEPAVQDAEADEDLDEDDYGEDYFDNGEGDFDDYAEVGDEDER